MPHGDHVILVLGADGQLGRAVLKELKAQDCNCVGATCEQFDVTQNEAISNLNNNFPMPTVLVNCAAYTDVQGAERNRQSAWKTNGWALSNLADWCMLKGAPLIHISTDFVFGCDRDRFTPYHEDSPVGPVNTYGMTKLCGENEILRTFSRRKFPYFILRTAGLFEMPQDDRILANNFVWPVGALLDAKRSVKVIDDVFSNITLADDLAKVVAWFAQNSEQIDYGIYHVANPGDLRWSAVAERIQTQFGRGEVTTCSREEWWEEKRLDPDRQPVYTCLDLRKYQNLNGPEMPNAYGAIERWCKAYKEMHP